MGLADLTDGHEGPMRTALLIVGGILAVGITAGLAIFTWISVSRAGYEK
jgi:hypothetical protein